MGYHFHRKTLARGVCAFSRNTDTLHIAERRPAKWMSMFLLAGKFPRAARQDDKLVWPNPADSQVMKDAEERKKSS
jgi:hypothetical protein